MPNFLEKYFNHVIRKTNKTRFDVTYWLVDWMTNKGGEWICGGQLYRFFAPINYCCKMGIRNQMHVKQ